MTDYGQFFENGILQTSEERRKNGKDAQKQYEEDKKAIKSCHTTVGRMGLFLRHCKSLQIVMKAASNEGFCLDELIQGVKELENTK